jgi:hypothetical protein
VYRLRSFEGEIQKRNEKRETMWKNKEKEERKGENSSEQGKIKTNGENKAISGVWGVNMDKSQKGKILGRGRRGKIWFRAICTFTVAVLFNVRVISSYHSIISTNLPN